jgi:nucleoside-diphosphate-sugar epimerase
MNLFIFGLGYSALTFLRGASRPPGLAATGTVRTAEKAERLRTQGVETFVFGPDAADPAIPAALARADALLVTAPATGGVDPALAAYGRAIAAAPGLSRILYLSTVAVYGDHDGAWVNERTPPAPASERGRARLAAEEGWRALGREAGRQVHVLRLPGIYGPGQNALAALREGRAKRLVKDKQVFNRIHVEDIARAIAACLATDLPGRVWNVCDDEPAPPQDVVAFGATLLGLPVPPDQPFATAKLSPMAASFYGENKRVSNRALRELLGVDLAYPTYREGLAALAAAGEGAPPLTAER